MHRDKVQPAINRLKIVTEPNYHLGIYSILNFSHLSSSLLTLILGLRPVIILSFSVYAKAA